MTTQTPKPGELMPLHLANKQQLEQNKALAEAEEVTTIAEAAARAAEKAMQKGVRR